MQVGGEKDEERGGGGRGGGEEVRDRGGVVREKEAGMQQNLVALRLLCFQTKMVVAGAKLLEWGDSTVMVSTYPYVS